MRILYLSVTSTISGGEHSLLDILRLLPAGIEPVVACPPGPLASEVSRLGIEVIEVRGTNASLRLSARGTLGGIADMIRTITTLRLRTRRRGFDLVHANSIQAGLCAVLAQRLGAPPAVVHVRDCLPPSALSRLSLGIIARGAAAVISNSRYTEASVQSIASPKLSLVLHSAVDLTRFDPTRIDRPSARARLALPPAAPVLAVIGQLIPWKGQDTAIRITADLARSYPEIRLLLVGTPKFLSGAARYDSRGYLTQLQALVRELGLERRVLFLGERSDVPEILRAVDILLVPSWEEPFGRVVVEALAMGVPVAATQRGGPAESINHGREGLLLAPRSPARWAAALVPLLESADLREAMGRRGRLRATEHFDLSRHVERLVDVYHKIKTGNRVEDAPHLR